MPILKHADILQPGKVFAELQKEIDLVTVSIKKLQDETRAMNKSGSGAEAKQRLDLSKQLTVQTNKLVLAETASVRVEQQILAANKKLVDAQQKESIAFA